MASSLRVVLAVCFVGLVVGLGWFGLVWPSSAVFVTVCFVRPTFSHTTTTLVSFCVFVDESTSNRLNAFLTMNFVLIFPALPCFAMVLLPVSVSSCCYGVWF